MKMRFYKALLGGLIGIAAVAAPAQAKILTFHVALDGKYGTEPSGSAATGSARVKVDTDRKRVSVDLTVDGITTEALWDKLVAAPIGPIHFHKYAVAGGRDAVLVLPLPYGADYQATKKGLHVDMKDYDYAAGTKLVGSSLSFDDFVAALRSGLVVLNVHTDAFNAGEISGKVTEG
jgi:hypothetical protein